MCGNKPKVHVFKNKGWEQTPATPNAMLKRQTFHVANSMQNELKQWTVFCTEFGTGEVRRVNVGLPV